MRRAGNRAYGRHEVATTKSASEGRGETVASSRRLLRLAQLCQLVQINEIFRRPRAYIGRLPQEDLSGSEYYVIVCHTNWAMYLLAKSSLGNDSVVL